MALKLPLTGSGALLEKIQDRLGPDRLPLLIAVDGPDGVGKSSLASWLAWQLGTPAIYLDLYVVKGSEPLQWRTEELSRVVSVRLDNRRKPVVVEGVMILDALQKIERQPDFLVYLDGEGSHALSERLADYRARCHPERRADFRMQGFVE